MSAPKLTPAQRECLSTFNESGAVYGYCSGRTVTQISLRRMGFLDDRNFITDAGRAAP